MAVVQAVVLSSIISSISIVYLNFFNGFTRVCHLCPHNCPDFITNCNQGRIMFIIGSACQIASLVRPST